MTCAQCQREMVETEFVDPDGLGRMRRKEHHCQQCGQEADAPRRHHCHLRLETLKVATWIAPEGDQESVPLGWETYPGLVPFMAEQSHASA